MSPAPRPAVLDDIEPIVALTAAHRRRLARWSPTWWRPSAAADQVHRLWLQHLLRADGAVVRVVDEGGTVAGCAVAVRQGPRWVVDDVALADDARWPGAGAALLGAIAARDDHDLQRVLEAGGLDRTVDVYAWPDPPAR